MKQDGLLMIVLRRIYYILESHQIYIQKRKNSLGDVWEKNIIPWSFQQINIHYIFLADAFELHTLKTRGVSFFQVLNKYTNWEEHILHPSVKKKKKKEKDEAYSTFHHLQTNTQNHKPIDEFLLFISTNLTAEANFPLLRHNICQHGKSHTES